MEHAPVKTKIIGLCVELLLVGLPCLAQPAAKPAWAAEVEQALARAGDNRAELVKALKTSPADQRRGMAFLIANMPDRDLRSLRADFLLENAALAYRVRDQVPWGRQIPEEIFLNHVLPYANVDEARHPWRKELYEVCLPLVKDCKTPAEAAHELNSTVFKQLQVRYSTQRKRPHQSPKESIEGGTASCTGLSILLSDACRSVAIPARLVGTPLWANKRGNHTWVEVWDKGWHFTGACEPDPKGLDHGWFVGDAAQAQKDSRVHAIYAASFRKTGVTFPLVWAPERSDVYAENVTDRYAKPADTRSRVSIRVWDADQKMRLAAPVLVFDQQHPDQVWRGESRGEGADTNDLLTFALPGGRVYGLRVGKPARARMLFRVVDQQQLVEIKVPPGQAQPASFAEREAREITKAAHAFFTASAAEQGQWKFDGALDDLLEHQETAVRRAVWQAYQSAPIHEAQKKDFEQNQVRYEKHLSPYTVKKVGKRPTHGWPLFIAMHGGGGVPKKVNDSQWEVMKRYYKDQDSVDGYLYLALRAPNDTWNGFYDTYMPPLVSNLIRQFLLVGDIDSNKVYLLGYSHGGYGAFFIGPKIPDHFAAVHSSAAARTDGTIAAKNLRNTRFTYMIGELDNQYGRRERCEKFQKEIQVLQKESPEDFPVVMEFIEKHGHGGLPDRDKIKDMYAFTRNPVPRRLSWGLTDQVIRHFFWLSVPEPSKGQDIDAVLVRDNTVRITTDQVKEFDLCFDSRLVDFERPVRVELDGQSQILDPRHRLLTLCQSLLERGDPELAFSCRVRLRASFAGGPESTCPGSAAPFED
jgi:predicted esterase